MYEPDLSAVRSDVLKDLRQSLESIVQLKELVGPIAVFRLVVDANILISEILWLQGRRRTPGARTRLQECIDAGTIIAYATPTILNEVEEHLPSLAGDRDPIKLMAEWESYKNCLNVVTPSATYVDKYMNGQDPDDAPTLGLADELCADGILTKDTDIKGMGGNPISIQFVLDARDYSRQSAIRVSIQVGGYTIALGAVGVFAIAVAALQKVAAFFSGLPDFAKWLLLMGVAFLILYPRTRDTVVEWIKKVAAGLSQSVPQAFELFMFFAQAVESNRVEPPGLSV